MAQAEGEILRSLEEVLGALVRADGGELYVIRADEGEIAVHLGGRFSGCPGNVLATRHVIEPAVKVIAPKAVLTVTSGVLLPAGARRVGE